MSLEDQYGWIWIVITLYIFYIISRVFVSSVGIMVMLLLNEIQNFNAFYCNQIRYAATVTFYDFAGSEQILGLLLWCADVSLCWAGCTIDVIVRCCGNSPKICGKGILIVSTTMRRLHALYKIKTTSNLPGWLFDLCLVLACGENMCAFCSIPTKKKQNNKHSRKRDFRPPTHNTNATT